MMVASAAARTEAARAAQIAGRAVPMDAMADSVRPLLDRIPTWSDFSLSQLSADGFAIVKRTQAGHAWVDATAGTRALGLGYVGSPMGGVALAAVRAATAPASRRPPARSVRG